MKNKFLENIDELFEALYGSEISVDSGNLYSSDYKYEVNIMLKDYVSYLESMKIAKVGITLASMSDFLIFIEYVHIGNKYFIVNNLNLDKLSKVASKLIV